MEKSSNEGRKQDRNTEKLPENIFNTNFFVEYILSRHHGRDFMLLFLILNGFNQY